MYYPLWLPLLLIAILNLTRDITLKQRPKRNFDRLTCIGLPVPVQNFIDNYCHHKKRLHSEKISASEFWLHGSWTKSHSDDRSLAENLNSKLWAYYQLYKIPWSMQSKFRSWNLFRMETFFVMAIHYTMYNVASYILQRIMHSSTAEVLVRYHLPTTYFVSQIHKLFFMQLPIFGINLLNLTHAHLSLSPSLSLLIPLRIDLINTGLIKRFCLILTLTWLELEVNQFVYKCVRWPLP